MIKSLCIIELSRLLFSSLESRLSTLDVVSQLSFNSCKAKFKMKSLHGLEASSFFSRNYVIALFPSLHPTCSLGKWEGLVYRFSHVYNKINFTSTTPSAFGVYNVTPSYSSQCGMLPVIFTLMNPSAHMHKKVFLPSIICDIT